MATELVLVISDVLVPTKSSSVNEQFKSILLPNKITYLLCLGNIGNQDTLFWLQNLSPNFHVVKGDYDIYRNYPDKKTLQIGSFRIGMIHGHQILPPGDMDALSNIQRELDCDVLLSGFTYKYDINVKNNKLFINPGSITGGLSPLMDECVPSFVLMAITGDEMIIYSYVLTDKNEKFQVGQIEYVKGNNELKIVKEIKFDEDEEIEEKNNININNENNKENNENNINNEDNKNLEEKPQEENNNIDNKEENKNEEVIYENKPKIQNENQEIKEDEKQEIKVEKKEIKEEEKQEINENEIKNEKIDA